MPRVRLLAIVGQPQFVTDDGEHLTPLSVGGASVTLTAADLAGSRAAELLARSLAELQAQVDSELPDDGDGGPQGSA